MLISQFHLLEEKKVRRTKSTAVVAVEMFRVVTNSSEYRLSPNFKAYESIRRGLH